ncbi:YjbH domain-containing protein, partial [Teichococcus cervicalis]
LAVALGDPSRTLRWQGGAAASARVELGDGWALAGSVQQALLGNLSGGLPSDSVLPHVRSDYAEYARQGKTALGTLYAERIWNAGPDLFARASAGYLEPMFGGVSAELLWRPRQRGFALGLDLNWVAQRDYDQKLGFLGYSVATGHVSAYADLPVWNLYGVLRAGRYLAGDWGTTIELGRRFESGIEVGGFATFTNVSAARFGEGSFDKGLYVRVPLELFGLQSRGRGTALIRPVQRDGGQMLAVDNPLWEVTRDGRAEALRRGSTAFAR